MRLVFVIPYFYPAWQYGGQPRSCYELARILVQRGHQVNVLTTDSAGRSRLKPQPEQSNGAVRINGIDVYYYRNLSNHLAYHHRLFWPAGFFREIDSRIQECDVIHFHELRSTLTVGAFRAARARKLPYVLSPHGGLAHLGKAAVKRVFDWLYGNDILLHASIVAAVSPREEKDAQAFRVDPSRIRLLPNAIFTEDYATLPPPGSFRSRWSIEGKRLVLFLGRLHWIKGTDLLIKAFSAVLQERSDVHLVVAGSDDGHESELRRLVSQSHIGHCVTFTGFLDHQAKLEALVDSDVLVIPSRSEVFAITALEGLACGTPVLMSSACGFSPLPDVRWAMHRFMTEDIRDLGQSLLRLLSDGTRPDLNACRRFVADEFSATAVAEKAEALYRDAMANGWMN